MANNCLVTKLKGTVNNPDLFKLNEWRFSSNSFLIRGNQNLTSTILSDNTFAADGSKIRVATDVRENQLSESKITELSIINKMDITYILLSLPVGLDLNVEGLEYNSNIDTFIVESGSANNTIVGDVSKIITNNPLNNLSFRAVKLKGNPTLSDLFKSVNTTITSVSFRDMYENQIHHVDNELSEFAKLTACTNLGWWNTDLKGSIEGYVTASRGYGRTTGTVSVSITPGSHITFKGEAVAGKSSPTNLVTLSWTANTITWDGVTINA